MRSKAKSADFGLKYWILRVLRTTELMALSLTHIDKGLNDCV